MKNKKKWIIILTLFITIAITISLYGRVIFTHLFINALLICTSEEQCKEEYQEFLEEKKQLPFKNDPSPWEYKEIDSKKIDVQHRLFYLNALKETNKTLVLFHGFNTDASSFLNFSPLSKYINLISYYLPEDTKLYQGDFSDYIPVLNDLFNEMNLDTVVLLGNSIGGAIVSHYVSFEKERPVKAVVLLASGNFGALEADAKKFQRARNLLLKHEDYRLFHMMKRGENILSLFRDDDSPKRGLVKKKITWYRQVLNALEDYRGVPVNTKTSIPALAIVGEKDRLITLNAAYAFKSVYNNISYHIVKGGRHGLYSANTEEVLQQIQQFLIDHVL